MDGTVVSKTLRGLKWSYAATAFNAILQIGFTAILSRLLEPASFGLVAMAGVVLRFGSYFAQIGFGSALVQKKELSNEEIHSAFIASLVLGGIVTLLTWFLAPFAVRVFHNDNIVAIIKIMSLTFILNGVSITAISVLRRQMNFRALAIVEVTSYFFGYGVIGVSMAYQGYGVWSLVAASLGQVVFTAVGSYSFIKHGIRLVKVWRNVKELFAYGSKTSVVGVLEAVAANIDSVLIGHLGGAAPLGIYNRAFMLVNLPVYYITSSTTKVLFPSFSQLRTSPDLLQRAYVSAILVASGLVFPICIGIMAASDEIIHVILGGRWASAVPVVQVLAIATPSAMLVQFSGIICDAKARFRIKVWIQVFHIGLLVVLFYSLRDFGVVGFAAALGIGEIVRQLAYAVIVGNLLSISYREHLDIYAPPVLSGLVVGCTVWGTSSLLSSIGMVQWGILLIDVIMGLFAWLVFFFWGPQKLLRREVLLRLAQIVPAQIQNKVLNRFVDVLRRA